MRSVLLSGVVPTRYTPCHARPSRKPIVVTTAGLTLSLMPALLTGTPHASAATALPAVPMVPVLTTIYSDVPAQADASGNVAVTAYLVAADQGLPGGQFELQVDDGTGWRATGTVAAGEDGKGVGTLPVAVPEKVRIHYPTDGLRSESFSKEWTVQPNAATLAALTEAARVAEVARQAAAAQQSAAAKAAAKAAVQAAAPRASRSARTASMVAPVSVPASGLAGAVLAEAAKHYGQAYRYGATGPTTFDCSGFTSYVFRQFGVSLPRTAGAQQAATTHIPVSQKQPGDLIFTWVGGSVTHVGIYAGGNLMWAATKTGDVVRLQTIYSSNITVGRV